VHDPGRVSLREPVRDLCGIPQRFAEFQPFAANQLVERPALDVLHHDEVPAVGRSDIVDGDDVRMLEGGRGLGFLDESPLAVGIRHLPGRQKLEIFPEIGSAASRTTTFA